VQRCEALGVNPSMRSRGDSYDNAMAGRFFSTLKCQCLARHRFATDTDARLTIFQYIEGGYNPHCRPSALGQRSPLAFERANAASSTSA
jgi:putative transposase